MVKYVDSPIICRLDFAATLILVWLFVARIFYVILLEWRERVY